MKHLLQLLVCAVIVASVATIAPAEETEETEEASSITLKQALKQMDKAVKGLRGLTARAEYEEELSGKGLSGSGQVTVTFDGRARVEVAGSQPRTIVIVLPLVYIYKPLQKTVEVWFAELNPDLLVQYALLGFTPSGSGLKKNYRVKLVREEVRDGRNMVVLSLGPKSKEASQVLTNLMLWIDTETWLPAGQLIRHQKSGLQVTLRYHDVVRNDDLPNDLFRGDWPEDTKVIQK